MFINEYGCREDPTIILLAPMLVSGADLYHLMKSFLRRQPDVQAYMTFS